jgi:G3E family GTPase
VEKFDGYLRSILWEDELPDNMPHAKFEIHRLKGRIPVSDGRLLLLQGVRNIYDINEAKSSAEEGSSDAKLVLIGRGVDQQAFRDSLLATLA